MKGLLSILALLLVSTSPMFAKTFYIAASGGSDWHPGTLSKPWATFDHALSSMVGGDTLIVGDGTYYQAILPKARNSGNAKAYTIIKAQNDGKATVDGSKVSPAPDATLFMYRLSYIQIEGLRVAGNPTGLKGLSPVFIDGSNHIKLMRLAGYNAPCVGNVNVFTIGPGSSYVLVEDSHAWGCGRYKFEVYQSNHVILRRDVSRHDYHDTTGLPRQITGWGRQCATFTSYDSTDILFQNDIAIDSGLADNSTGKLWGGLWVENNLLVDNSLEVEGSIFLNLRGLAGINDGKEGGTHIYTNDVLWDTMGGLVAGYLRGVKPTPTLMAQHMTFGNISGKAQDTSYSWGTGSGSGSANFIREFTTNSIIQNAASFGISNYMTSDYNVFYKNTANYGTSIYQGPVPKSGTHDRTVNPQLKYITHAEAGSPLIGTASDGGNIGATILYEIGEPGTLWGDAGYNTVTSTPLWPFPNEAAIKADMASYNGPGPAGARGFAAPGVGLYGEPITLTSYIWEYLGYACPTNVCSGAKLTGGTVSPSTTRVAAGHIQK